MYMYVYVYIYIYICVCIYMCMNIYSDSIECQRKLIVRCEICLNLITKTP